MALKFLTHPFGSFDNYRFADIIATYNGKWVFCKHKERDTWETQGGHIDEGEAPLDAAKRELYEETGTTSFDIEPLCDYLVEGDLRGVEISACGQVYFAKIHAFGDIPHGSEMEKICITDAIPKEQTYPDYMNEIFPIAQRRRRDLLK